MTIRQQAERRINHASVLIDMIAFKNPYYRPMLDKVQDHGKIFVIDIDPHQRYLIMPKEVAIALGLSLSGMEHANSASFSDQPRPYLDKAGQNNAPVEILRHGHEHALLVNEDLIIDIFSDYYKQPLPAKTPERFTERRAFAERHNRKILGIPDADPAPAPGTPEIT